MSWNMHHVVHGSIKIIVHKADLGSTRYDMNQANLGSMRCDCLNDDNNIQHQIRGWI